MTEKILAVGLEDDFETQSKRSHRNDDLTPAKSREFQWLWGQRDNGRVSEKRRRPACFNVPAFFSANSRECRSCAFSDLCSKKHTCEVGRMASGKLAEPADAAFRHAKMRDMPKDDKHGVYATIRRFYVDIYQQSLKQTRLREKRAKQSSRAAAKASGMHQIEVGAIKRLALLRAATNRSRKSARIEQLVGREAEIVSYWKAMQLVGLKSENVTDKMVAHQVYLMSERMITKHQSRAMRLLIVRLEKPGEVWAQIANLK
jgi:uncharacterized protein YdaU (DUF1376 family)